MKEPLRNHRATRITKDAHLKIFGGKNQHTGSSAMEILFSLPDRMRWNLKIPDTQAKLFQNQEHMTCRENSIELTNALVLVAELWIRDCLGHKKWKL